MKVYGCKEFTTKYICRILKPDGISGFSYARKRKGRTLRKFNWSEHRAENTVLFSYTKIPLARRTTKWALPTPWLAGLTRTGRRKEQICSNGSKRSSVTRTPRKQTNGYHRKSERTSFRAPISISFFWKSVTHHWRLYTKPFKKDRRLLDRVPEVWYVKWASSNVGGASGVCRCPGANPGACVKGAVMHPFLYDGLSISAVEVRWNAVAEKDGR